MKKIIVASFAFALLSLSAQAQDKKAGSLPQQKPALPSDKQWAAASKARSGKAAARMLPATARRKEDALPTQSQWEAAAAKSRKSRR